MNELGVPQGGVLSPLLSNIYLDKFDSYMKELTIENNWGKLSPDCNEFRRSLRKLGNRKAGRKMGLQPVDMTSDKCRRMAYVRYADDFVISLACDRATAIEIKNRIAD